jgi:hypothetical protein
MWELSKGFTTELFRNASHKLICLIYTAWLNAGSPVSVEDENSVQLASNFELAQNYPNPFNPTTTISYTIPNVTLSRAEGSRVQLKIYDVLGNEVVTLVNEYKPAGSYEVRFDASILSSGVYFYKLQTGNLVETKKMILMK